MLMKKFTLFAVTAFLMAVTAVAQHKGGVMTQAKPVASASQAKPAGRPVLKITDAKPLAEAQRSQSAKAAGRQALSLGQQKQAGQPLKKRNAKPASLAKRRAAGIITEQPAGTYYNMNYATSYYGYSFLYGLYAGSYTAALGEVVEGTDGCLYIHNLLTELYTEEGYWVKAEKVSGQADTYVIHEQPIYAEEYEGTVYTYYIKKGVISDGTVVAAKNTDIKVTWKDHQLRTEFEVNLGPESPLATFMAAFDDDENWTGAMNWDVTMTENSDVAITELPAGVEPQEVVLKYYNGTVDDNDERKVVAKKTRMAVSGSDVYLQCYEGIDSWIRGTIDAGRVTFASGQYLGPEREHGQHAYFLAASADDEGNLTIADAITFDYDAAEMRLSNSGLNMLANGGKDEVYWIKFYGDPEIYKFVEKAATPATPDANAMSGYNYMPSYGYGWFDFTLRPFDADGEFINPEKLYYRVYIGTGWEDEEAGEHPTLFTFTPDVYPELEEPMTDVPYTLRSSDFWSSDDSHEFSFYLNLPYNIGIQAVYKGGGEERVSEIAWGMQFDNNRADGGESLFPHVANAQVNSELADGEIALNLGAAKYGFGSGLGAEETYDVAMKVEDSWMNGAKLSGKKISAISVPFFTKEGLSDTKVWLSTSIALDANGKFVPDLVSKSFSVADNGYTMVKLDEPVEIPAEGGIYIGYSFKQAPGEDENTLTPVVLTNYTNNGGFLIHTDQIYRLGWASMVGAEGDLAIEAVLTGGEADAAELDGASDSYQKTGEGGFSTVVISNYGYNGLQSAELNTKLLGDDVEIDGTCELTDLQLPRVFGAYTTANITIPAVSQPGDFLQYYDVVKANGRDNAIEDDEAQNNVFVMNFLPKKRPLLEEYTGTWCQWCPRGYVALEKMAELYPEDFVALSYHNRDLMEFTRQYPSDVQGFPSAFMDRSAQVDAYYGDGENDFGIEQTWKERSRQFGTADIDVEAQWSDDMKTINVKSTATFAKSEDFCNYTIGYAVAADGLTGTGSDWTQANAYAGQAQGTPLYMEQFYNAPGDVSGLVFNDVIVASTSYDGIEGSLPETIVGETPYTHTYSFNVDEIVNTSGEPLIQDKSKVKVVAMLLNWGQVSNANKCRVASSTEGISELAGRNGQVVKTQYFDLSGRRVLVPSNGIYMKTIQYKNGTTATQKVVVK